MARIERFTRAERRQRADDANSKAFVHVVWLIKPTIAEFEIADTQAGQPEAGQRAADGYRIVLDPVNVLADNSRLNRTDLRRHFEINIEALKLQAHIIRELLLLLEVLGAGFEID